MQKTAYEMRISDWSSDVCSSDLHEVVVAHACRGDVVSALHPRERVALPGSGDRDDDERGSGERRVREREARVRVEVVAVGGDQPLRLRTEERRGGKERCRT